MTIKAASGVFKNAGPTIAEPDLEPAEEPDYAALSPAELYRLARDYERKAFEAKTTAEERQWTGRQRNCATEINRRLNLS